MGRIDEIKKKLNEYGNDIKMQEEIEDFSDDVEYLLSKLEIADKSITELHSRLWDVVHEDGYTVIWDDVENILKDAIKQIRE